jgi:hypothetical protein
MMKLYEHPTTHDTKERPKLPPGVVVPDDISGLEAPEARQPGHGRQVRWLRWMAVVVLLAVGAVVIGTLVRDDSTTTVETPSAQQLIQDQIDQALLDNQTTTVQTPSAYQLIQDSIDQALLDNQ